MSELHSEYHSTSTSGNAHLPAENSRQTLDETKPTQSDSVPGPRLPRGYVTSRRVIIPPGARRRAPTPPPQPEQDISTPTRPVEMGATEEVESPPLAAAVPEMAPAPQELIPEQLAPTVEVAPQETAFKEEIASTTAVQERQPAMELTKEPVAGEISTQPTTVFICPFLGLREDPSSRFLEPSPAHRCYSPKGPGDIALRYQSEFCLTDRFGTCARFSHEADITRGQPSAVSAPGSPSIVEGKGALAAPEPIAPLPSATVPRYTQGVGPTGRGRGRWLELVLWAAAILLALVAIATIAPILFPDLSASLQIPGLSTVLGIGAPVSSPTRQVSIVLPSPTAEPSPTPEPTATPSLTPLPTVAPLVVPTAPEGGLSFTNLPLDRLTGWVSSAETLPRWNEPRLIAGTIAGEEYVSIVQFDLRNLPPDSQILFGVLELTGRELEGVLPTSQWQVEIVPPLKVEDWLVATSEQLLNLESLGTVGAPIPGTDIAPNRINRVYLGEADRQLLAQQFAAGRVAFRIRGPKTDSDSYVTWYAGPGGRAIDAPQLTLVVVPGKYVIVTNTPEPKNVLTAAAYVVRGTDQARRFGTPTPFPPGVATATPGGELVPIDSSTAIPDNQQTAIARAILATAVAVTTGTYTPTPPGVVIIFPTNTPVILAPEELATPKPTPKGRDLLQVAIPENLRGLILAKSTFFGDSAPGAPILISPEGKFLGKLSGDLYYNAANYREQFSPDGSKQLVYLTESDGRQQIGYLDLHTNETVRLTNFNKGVAYDAAWAPDGNAIVFVSTVLNNTDEIYVLELGARDPVCITCGTTDPRLQPFNKHPSFSPDGQRIVFWSSRSGRKQIWLIDRNGGNLINLSVDADIGERFDEIDPVWVK